MARDLTRIGEKALKESKTCFTSLYHYLTDLDHLRSCFERIKPGKAPGIDGVTKEEYAEDLESNLQDLSGRLSRLAYRPPAVKRQYIPKIGSKKMRPLGLPCLEDKIVQMSVARVLEQIYEADFLPCSYGYRHEITQHRALDELGRTIQQRKINFVVDADIKGFFDHVNHEWLMKFLALRVGDRRILRLIWRMLKAGIMEDGLTKASEEGTPQGGVLSPLLSNVYLHYVLDLWFEKRFKPGCRGEAHLYRYADDFDVCFQYQEDAERFLLELKERLAKFHLEIEPTKTQLLAFGRFAARDAQGEGKKPESFDFLGFTFYCDQTRTGKFKVKRRTCKTKYRAKLKELQMWLKKARNRQKGGEILKSAKQRLVGHLNYYAITDNSRMCDRFARQMERMLWKWLNRRSQRRSYNWDEFKVALAWVRWPKVRIRHNLSPFLKLAPE